MKCFKLDSNGDVAIMNNQIQMVEGSELIKQTVQSVLNTNKGEWVLNKDEGINFKNILGKHNAKPQKQENNAMKTYYNGEISKIKNAESELSKRLEERLEGR